MVVTSTMYIMAVMITAASVAFGMYWNVLVKKPIDRITTIPVAMPPNGVLTALASLTAVRVKDPVNGIDETNDPNMLQQPRAIIS